MEQGVLQLTLRWDGGHILAAGVASTRPAVARVLRGLPLARVLEFVPRLFSLCRCAQDAAARLSLQAARGQGPALAASAAQTLAVALEAIGEHLWRLLLDWPPLCGQPSRKSEFLLWRKRLQGVVDAAAATALGTCLLDWLDSERPPLFDDCSTGAPVALLPRLAAADWGAHFDSDVLCELPTFAGQPAETGALARHAEDAQVAPLLAFGQRLQARLRAAAQSPPYEDAEPCALPVLDDDETLPPPMQPSSLTPGPVPRVVEPANESPIIQPSKTVDRG